ncbi:hypothetical protein BDY19DRAFT_685147 [Irpex rosettiformis]|uniref:Uncharacterized protein n=1 Tax=Irpex rosettiformis TaxID=378272 RepID=A0ACB8UA07_9APHY|nr:hypothetical protein BDY19DRAFT_685147 [Irpex rosettiformis]
MSATASTPSPSLSSISTGQPKPKPKSKVKKKLSVFAGAVDFMNSDLEWFAKHKAKDAEVKQEGAVEKIAQLRTREEPKVEEEGQLGKEDALKAMEERGTDSGEKSAEGEMETVPIKKDTREGGTDTPALSARFEASAKDSNAMQQDSEAQVESEMKKDRPAPEGEEPEGTGDEQDRVDEEQMDVVTDDGESDKVEQILVHDIDYECEKLTEQITVGEIRW